MFDFIQQKFLLMCSMLTLAISLRPIPCSPISTISKTEHRLDGAYVKTLLIDNYDSYTYNLWQLLSATNKIEPHVIYNDDCNSWKAMIGQNFPFDNIVISPGPGNPSTYCDFGICREAIFQSNHGIPVLGVCLGHQGIVDTFSGVVTRAPQPMHGRLSKISHMGTGIFTGVEQNVNVVRYHSLVVTEPLPSNLRATAWTSDGLIMGLEDRSKPLFGVQFHPESIATQCGPAIISNFMSITTNTLKNRRVANTVGLESSTTSKGSSLTAMTPIQPLRAAESRSTVATFPLPNNSHHFTRIAHISRRKLPSPLQSTGALEAIFRENYASSPAAFWLDSASLGAVASLHDDHVNRGKVCGKNLGSDASMIQEQATHPEGSYRDNGHRLSFLGSLDFDSSEAAKMSPRQQKNQALPCLKKFVACNPSIAIEYVSHNRLLFRHPDGHEQVRHQNIFEYLDEELRKELNNTSTSYLFGEGFAAAQDLGADAVTDGNAAPTPLSVLPFNISSALFGYIGYEARHEAAHILRHEPKGLQTPPHTPQDSQQQPLDMASFSTAAGSAAAGYNYSSTHTADFTGSVWSKELRQPLALFLKPTRFLVFDHLEQFLYTVSLAEFAQKDEAGESNAAGPSGNGKFHTAGQTQAEMAALVAESRAKQLNEQVDEVLSRLHGLDPVRDVATVQINHDDDIAEPKACHSQHSVGDDCGSHQRREVHTTKTQKQYMADIERCMEYIRAGDSYELCLTMQATGRLLAGTDALGLHSSLRARNAAPYGCFLHYDPSRFGSRNNAPPITGSSRDSGKPPSSELREAKQLAEPSKERRGPRELSSLWRGAASSPWWTPGGLSISSSSPERYLKISSDGVIESKPIKGTARRALGDPAADRLIAQALQRDEKSRAENLMIVDLVRNDLGRVCRVGSVHVPRLMTVESFATVHQLVSTVRGRLRPDRTVVDALVATFPGGSMTGAPKVRTMNLIEQLEGRPRGVYSGAIGYIGLNGVVDLNIVIRTAVVHGDELTIGAGGAIVALSDPRQEVEEVLLKARAVGSAIGYDVQFDEG